MYIVNVENLSFKTVLGFLNPFNFYKGVTLMFGIGGGARTSYQITTPSEFFDLSCKTINGETYSFSELKTKVVLITNTASFCLAAPRNYKQLAELDKKYRDQGLVVLAFPCNQFYAQEYKSSQDTVNCTKKYGVDFTVMETVNVNGDETHPVYKYLKKSTGGSDVSWNFASKFLINRGATEITRYIKVDPLELEVDIQRLLAAS